MHLIDRYIAKIVINFTLLVVVVLIGIEGFLELVAQLQDIGVGNYGILQVFIYVPMQIPADLYQLFPIAGFLGSLLGLGYLASSSQLIAIRAAGISIAQIAWAVIKATVLMLLVVTLIGEWIGPVLQQKALIYKEQAMQHPNLFQIKRGLWLRRANNFIYIQKIISSQLVDNITEYQFDTKNHLLQTIQAKQAQLLHGKWQMQDVLQTIFLSNSVISKHYQQLPLEFHFTPQFLATLQVNSLGESIGQSILGLLKSIHYRKQVGLVTSRLQLAFWQRVLQPMTTVLTILLGIPFIFGSLRSASTGLRVMTGVFIGFIFYMMNQFFGPITLVYQLPPLLAASMPTLLFLAVYLIMVWQVRR